MVFFFFFVQKTLSVSTNTSNCLHCTSKDAYFLSGDGYYYFFFFLKKRVEIFAIYFYKTKKKIIIKEHASHGGRRYWRRRIDHWIGYSWPTY